LKSPVGVRLSASFFMRDFLHSEIADFHGRSAGRRGSPAPD
jgi:hypothetical protein